jgi:membrane protein
LIRTAGQLAWRAFWRFQRHGGPDRAAAVAFYTLLSILPLFIFVIWVGARVLGSFDRAYEGSLLLFGGIVVHLDPKTLESLRAFVERAALFQWPALVLLAWTARGIFISLFSQLETIFDRPSRRGFVKGNLLAFGLVIFLGIAQVATMALTTTIATTEGLLLRYFSPEERVMVEALASRFFTLVLPAVITYTFLFLLYWMAPRQVTTLRHAALGALLATVLWEAAKAGFSYYLRNLARFIGLYGALEGVIVLALWLELSVSIIFYCGEIVALSLRRDAADAGKSLPEVPLPTAEVEGEN